MKDRRSVGKLLLGLLYPPKCMFCKRNIPVDYEENVCAECLGKLPYTQNDGCFEVFGGAEYLISPLYYRGYVKTAIRDMKFKAKHENAAVLSRIMLSYVQKIDEAMCADAVVNVPLSKRSLLERGFNQTELLAAPIAEKLGIRFLKDALVKTRETKRQSSLTTLAERMENIANAYECAETLDGMTILLVDDVYTSGMTVYHCADALLKGGAKKVIALTAANAHKDVGMSMHDYNSAHILFGKNKL